MKIAVLSGKGGAGKTFVAVNLAVAKAENLGDAGGIALVDCDVEEPDAGIFLRPEKVKKMPVGVFVPEFSADKCIGCKKCVEFCAFNALALVKKLPTVFPEVCHFCGGCRLVCPVEAVTERERIIGRTETGRRKNLDVITGVLNPGETSGVPVIERCKEAAKGYGEVVFDCPPGSSCPVVESVSDADFCVIVVEPTAFGFEDFKTVFELTKIMEKKCGAVVNKEIEPYLPLENFCRENDIKILSKIPYNPEVAAKISDGEILAENNEFSKVFSELADKIEEAFL